MPKDQRLFPQLSVVVTLENKGTVHTQNSIIQL